MMADDRLNPQLEQSKRCGELIMAASDEHPGAPECTSVVHISEMQSLLARIRRCA